MNKGANPNELRATIKASSFFFTLSSWCSCLHKFWYGIGLDVKLSSGQPQAPVDLATKFRGPPKHKRQILLSKYCFARNIAPRQQILRCNVCNYMVLLFLLWIKLISIQLSFSTTVKMNSGSYLSVVNLSQYLARIYWRYNKKEKSRDKCSIW